VNQAESFVIKSIDAYLYHITPMSVLLVKSVPRWNNFTWSR